MNNAVRRETSLLGRILHASARDISIDFSLKLVRSASNLFDLLERLTAYPPGRRCTQLPSAILDPADSRMSLLYIDLDSIGRKLEPALPRVRLRGLGIPIHGRLLARTAPTLPPRAPDRHAPPDGAHDGNL